VLTFRERLESLGNEKAASNAKTNDIAENIEATEVHIERCSILTSSALNAIITMERQLQGLQDDPVLVVGKFGRGVRMNGGCLTLDLFSETDLEGPTQ
jgi:hypothetical protein